MTENKKQLRINFQRAREEARRTFEEIEARAAAARKAEAEYWAFLDPDTKLQARVDELEATLARVEALATSWESALTILRPDVVRLFEEHARAIREAIAGPEGREA